MKEKFVMERYYLPYEVGIELIILIEIIFNL